MGAPVTREPAVTYDSAAARTPAQIAVTLWQRRPLIALLMRREVARRHRRSLLGVGWTLLGPVILALALWTVFSRAFAFPALEVPYFVYVLSGTAITAFVGQTLVGTGSSLAANAGLVRTIPVPAEVLAVSSLAIPAVTLAAALPTLLAVMVLSGVAIPATVLALPLFGLVLLAGVVGASLAIAALSVRYSDLLEAVRIAVLLLTYLTPVFYPLSIVPEPVRVVVELNPLHHAVLVFRGLVYGGDAGPWWAVAGLVGTAVLAVVVGAWTFERMRRTIALAAVKAAVPPTIAVDGVSVAYPLPVVTGGLLKGLGARLRAPRGPAPDVINALQDVSLTIRPGETVALVGANGAGKSTLLKVVAGLFPPTAGRVVVRGRVGLLSSLGVGLDLDATLRENVALYGALLGGDPARLRDEAGEVLDWAQLSAYADVPAVTLSSGMLARLAFAVALGTHPDVLLVDEVFAVGDADFQRRSSDRLRAMITSGSTTVIVSHDLDAVRRYAQRVVWMHRGAVVDDGPVDAVLDRYRATAPDARVGGTIEPRS